MKTPKKIVFSNVVSERDAWFCRDSRLRFFLLYKWRESMVVWESTNVTLTSSSLQSRVLQTRFYDVLGDRVHDHLGLLSVQSTRLVNGDHLLTIRCNLGEQVPKILPSVLRCALSGEVGKLCHVNLARFYFLVEQVRFVQKDDNARSIGVILSQERVVQLHRVVEHGDELGPFVSLLGDFATDSGGHPRVVSLYSLLHVSDGNAIQKCGYAVLANNLGPFSSLGYLSSNVVQFPIVLSLVDFAMERGHVDARGSLARSQNVLQVGFVVGM